MPKLYDFCNDEFKQHIVTAIKDGLIFTHEEYSSSGKLKNSVNFKKIDNIGNSIIRLMETNHQDEFVVPIILRGSYEVFMIFHKESKTLITFMSTSNKDRIMKRKAKSVHYFEALVDFNTKHHLTPDYEQQNLGEEYVKHEQEKLDPIKLQVMNQLDGIEPEFYSTVVFGMDGLNLTSVEIMLISEFMDIIKHEDWSEYIEVDYHNNYDVIIDDYSYDSLDISIKPDKINKNHSVEIEVTDIDKQQNEK